MDIAEALQIVTDLARQNIADQLDCPNFYKKQREACDMVEDLTANEYGIDRLSRRLLHHRSLRHHMENNAMTVQPKDATQKEQGNA